MNLFRDFKFVNIFLFLILSFSISIFPSYSERPSFGGNPLSEGTTLVKSVKLDSSSGSELLVVELDSMSTFSLDKHSLNEYSLSISNAKLSSDVIKLVIPKGQGSLRAVKPRKTKDGVMLSITTEPLTILDYKVEGSKIVLVSNNQIEAGEVLAQSGEGEGAKPEGESEVLSTPEDIDVDVNDDDFSSIFGEDEKYQGRLISLDLQDTEIDNALRIIAEVSNLNIIASDDVTGKVTLRLIDVPWDQALDVILKTNGLDKVQEGNVVRIAPVEKLRAERESLREARKAEEELEPLKVKYIRISYAKAAELAPLVESVITERGVVAYDERSNQLIIKDIGKGITNVSNLVEKLDLRTPQVLIETQIVEASRSFIRELGSQLGFFYIRSPETGNPTGFNFPNSIEIGGSQGAGPTSVGETGGGTPLFSDFAAPGAQTALSALFGSADGTKGLDVRITAAETEGRVRVVSRPSVAVTNNSPAVIRSVEKLRIRLPGGGVSVASGAGASAQGAAGVATETIEIGIVLEVTAQASPDYYVLVDINAKSSTLGPASRGIQDIPPEIERSASSSILVSSGQTFALGGIYAISEESGVSGVPYLKDIPFLGHLFRSSVVNDQDEELIFFLTPRIIEGSFDDAAMSEAVS